MFELLCSSTCVREYTLYHSSFSKVMFERLCSRIYLVSLTHLSRRPTLEDQHQHTNSQNTNTQTQVHQHPDSAYRSHKSSIHRRSIVECSQIKVRNRARNQRNENVLIVPRLCLPRHWHIAQRREEKRETLSRAECTRAPTQIFR